MQRITTIGQIARHIAQAIEEVRSRTWPLGGEAVVVLVVPRKQQECAWAKAGWKRPAMGVIAIIITIMVLELKVSHGAGFDVLMPLLPILGSYVLSFIYVGIYWNELQYGCYPGTPTFSSVIA